MHGAVLCYSAVALGEWTKTGRRRGRPAYGCSDKDGNCDEEPAEPAIDEVDAKRVK